MFIAGNSKVVTGEAGQLLTASERSKKDGTFLSGACAICIPNPSPGLKQLSSKS